jgi:hypothetical protein
VEVAEGFGAWDRAGIDREGIDVRWIDLDRVNGSNGLDDRYAIKKLWEFQRFSATFNGLGK